MGGVPHSDADPLRRRVMIYTLVRLTVVSGFFGLAIVLTLQSPEEYGRSQFFRIAAGAYLWIGMSAALVRTIVQLRPFVVAQLVFDMALVSALVFETGGDESVFSVLYFVNIIGAAYLMQTPGAVAAAVLDGVAYAGLALWAWHEGGEVGQGYAAIMLHVFGFLLVGLLTGRLSTQLARAGEALRVVRSAARKLAEEHAAVLDRVPSGVFFLDADAVVQAENREAVGVLGSVLGSNIDSLFPGLRQSDGPVELSVATARGPRTILADCSAPTDDEVFIVVFEDVTRLREMEAAIERKERLEGVGRMAAAIAHEIRNPLASLSGALQMLADERRDELVDLAQREVQRLQNLVDQSLERVRPSPLRVRVVELDPVVHEVVRSFGNDPHYVQDVKVTVLGETAAPILLDPDRLRQVVWNLLLNAAQAMPEGGHIEVELAEEGRGVLLSVTDEGPGLTQEVAKRIFDPFYTQKRGGTGLGLSTVEQIVHAHSGTVAVVSAEGKGARFQVFLPRKP
jgi:two-component system sensor histidine kinase PilS (NtrC family)